MLKRIYAAPAWLVFLLTSPGMVFLVLIFLEEGLGLIRIPSGSAWFPYYIEDFLFTGVFATYLGYVVYLTGVVWSSLKNGMAFYTALLFLGLQLIVAVFICLIGMEEIFSHLSLIRTDRVGPAFREMIRYVGDTNFFVAWGASALLSPWISAYALNRLERRKNFGRWLLAGVLFTLWPLGVWWLHPRLREIFSARDQRTLEDHYVT